MSKFLDDIGLAHLWGKIKTYVANISLSYELIECEVTSYKQILEWIRDGKSMMIKDGSGEYTANYNHAYSITRITGPKEQENILDLTWFDGTVERNGITFTNNGDGTVTANGTATADADFGIKRQNVSPALYLTDGVNYILSGCPAGGSTSTYYMFAMRTNGGSAVNYGEDTGAGIEFTGVSGVYQKTGVWIRIKAGTTVENLTFTPYLSEKSPSNNIILEASDKKDNYNFIYTIDSNNNWTINKTQAPTISYIENYALSKDSIQNGYTTVTVEPNQYVTQTVNYSEFDSIPIVVASVSGDGLASSNLLDCYCNIVQISTDFCILKIVNNSSTQQDLTINWIAIKAL